MNKTYTACILNDEVDSNVSNMFFNAGYNVLDIHDIQLRAPFDVKDHKFILASLDRMKQSDLLVFCGGTDINSQLYGEVRHPLSDHPDSTRDIFETILWKEARRLDIPTVGICRGAQLLNVLSGGLLDQHTDSHFKGHTIKLVDEELTGIQWMYAPANHHQVMLPSEDATILAVSDANGDTEVVYYHHSRSLCHQPHPEWVSTSPMNRNPYYNWFFEHVDSLLLGEDLVQ